MSSSYTTALGLMRLRVSVAFGSPRRALLRYVRPPPAALRGFGVPFDKASDLKAAQFAALGPSASIFDAHAALRGGLFAPWDERFNLEVLLDHKREVHAAASNRRERTDRED